MGIAHLSTYLQPYSTNVILGRHNYHQTESVTVDGQDPTLHVVIDGPALAYNIYHQLLASQSINETSLLDARPSYNELGKGILAFLDQLEAHGLNISSIYFDGNLPPRKRDIRIKRLESSLKELIAFQKRHPDGFPISAFASAQLIDRCSHLFSPRLSLPSSRRKIPTPPFIVPAVLDTLAQSKYASITAIVPGEADAYCAKTAREIDEEAVILTGDSDLLVYDLGPHGGVVFFNTLDIEETDGIPTLKASVHRSAEIAKSLELPDLKRLAHEIRLDANVGFAEAKRRANSPVKDMVSWQQFVEEYSDPLASAGEPRALEPGKFLDPRLSELILQLITAAAEIINEEDITIYLPFLTEDPSRTSAWDVSSHIRHLAYLMLVSPLHDNHHRHPYPLASPTMRDEESNITINEVSRRGNRIVSSPLPFNSSISPPHKSQHPFYKLIIRLDATKTHFPILPPCLRYRTFALKETLAWYIDNDKTPPSPSLILEVLTGECMDGVLSWENVHLTAQVEAVLYALRMLRQVAVWLEGMEGEEGEILGEIMACVSDLPDIGSLMPGGGELQGMWTTVATAAEVSGHNNVRERMVQWIINGVHSDRDFGGQ
ncbi:MAG: hypothetical protein Q9220_007343 [cf. Caloplaca sp. 1 TL-2023]